MPSRSQGSIGGTTEPTATPTSSAGSTPCQSRSWRSHIPTSSAVRSAWVDSRQRDTSSVPWNSPTTVFVLPTSSTSSSSLTAAIPIVEGLQSSAPECSLAPREHVL